MGTVGVSRTRGLLWGPGDGDVCGTSAVLGVQRRMKRVVSRDEGPGAQEGMESYGTGVGMGGFVRLGSR